MPKKPKTFAELLTEKDDHYDSIADMQRYFRSVLEHPDFDLETVISTFTDGQSMYHFCGAVNDMTTPEREVKLTFEQLLQLGEAADAAVMEYNCMLFDRIVQVVTEAKEEAEAAC